MKLRMLLLAIPLLLSTALVSNAALAQSGNDTISQFNAEVQAVATDVAEIRVLSRTSVQVDGETYTIVDAEITSSDSLTTGERILLDVPGGTNPAGNQIIVSHQPYFEVGDVAFVALAQSTWQGFGQLFGASDLPVYSVVGGIDGVNASPGAIISQANAAGDFTLTGSRFGSVPVTYYVNAGLSGLGSTSQTVAAVKRGFDIWEADAGSDVEFSYGGTTGKAGNLADGHNTVYWTNTPNPAHSYLAQASWTATPGGEIIAFDIKFNRDYQWSNGAQAGRWDIATTVVHEAGHALGLGHSSTPLDVMYFQIVGGTTKPLGPGDKAGAAHLYPAQSKDPARVEAVQTVLGALESYGEQNSSYSVTGSGWKGNGEGWFQFTGANNPTSIANKLSSLGYFPSGIPTDPEGSDFLVYRCNNRIAVFARTDSAGPSTADRNWWTNNGCTNYPASKGYNYIDLSQPLPTNDPARIAAVASIVSGLESYGNTFGTYTVANSGWKGKGEGWFHFTGANNPTSIASRLSSSGHLSNPPTDPNGRDFLVYRCNNRIAVFARTDSAGPSTADRNWWTNNGCTNYPASRGYNYIDLSAILG